MARPLKEILERDGEKYLVAGFAPVEGRDAYLRFQQVQRQLQADGFSCLLEREHLKSREVYRLLHSLKPIHRGENKPAVPTEVVHEE